MAIRRLLVALAVSLVVVSPSAQTRAGEVVSGDAAKRVDAYLTGLVPYGFSGAVLIAKDGQVALKKAYGAADKSANLPYAVDMVSCIGSVTKQFTGAAILKLEMQGKLKTSDPISTYLPGVPADKAGITIEHLMSHTAGFSGDLGGSDEEPITADALLKKVLAAPLAARPGEAFEYSNEGFSLAGMIVERVSGKGYEAFLRDELWLPAGMKDTGYLATNTPLSRMPIGYTAEGRAWGRTFKNGWLPDGPGWYLRANGGIHSTLDDLHRWHVALEGTNVLSADAVKKYQSGIAPAPGPGGERYGYGWGVHSTRRNTRVVAHNGGNGYFFTDFRRYMDEKVVIIAMSNQPVIPATQLAPRQLESLWFGDAPVVMPPVSIDVPKPQRDAIAGRYTLTNGATVTIRSTDAGLEAESTDPAIFGAIPDLMPPGGRSAELEQRTLPLIDAASKGDFKPLFTAFNDDRPLSAIEEIHRPRWAAWRAEFGEFQRAELLGTAMVQGDPAVTIKLHFAKGGPTLQLIWGPRRLAGFRTLPVGASILLTPESTTQWAYFAYRNQEILRVTFGSGGQISIAQGAKTLTGQKQ
jgi:CubicO group peptidase (beta-lactamase class C family)